MRDFIIPAIILGGTVVLALCLLAPALCGLVPLTVLAALFWYDGWGVRRHDRVVRRECEFLDHEIDDLR